MTSTDLGSPSNRRRMCRLLLILIHIHRPAPSEPTCSLKARLGPISNVTITLLSWTFRMIICKASKQIPLVSPTSSNKTWRISNSPVYNPHIPHQSRTSKLIPPPPFDTHFRTGNQKKHPSSVLHRWVERSYTEMRRRSIETVSRRRRADRLWGWWMLTN